MGACLDSDHPNTPLTTSPSSSHPTLPIISSSSEVPGSHSFLHPSRPPVASPFSPHPEDHSSKVNNNKQNKPESPLDSDIILPDVIKKTSDETESDKPIDTSSLEPEKADHSAHDDSFDDIEPPDVVELEIPCDSPPVASSPVEEFEDLGTVPLYLDNEDKETKFYIDVHVEAPADQEIDEKFDDEKPVWVQTWDTEKEKVTEREPETINKLASITNTNDEETCETEVLPATNDNLHKPDQTSTVSNIKDQDLNQKYRNEGFNIPDRVKPALLCEGLAFAASESCPVQVNDTISQDSILTEPSFVHAEQFRPCREELMDVEIQENCSEDATPSQVPSRKRPNVNMDATEVQVGLTKGESDSNENISKIEKLEPETEPQTSETVGETKYPKKSSPLSWTNDQSEEIPGDSHKKMKFENELEADASRTAPNKDIENAEVLDVHLAEVETGGVKEFIDPESGEVFSKADEFSPEKKETPNEIEENRTGEKVDINFVNQSKQDPQDEGELLEKERSPEESFVDVLETSDSSINEKPDELQTMVNVYPVNKSAETQELIPSIQKEAKEKDDEEKRNEDENKKPKTEVTNPALENLGEEIVEPSDHGKITSIDVTFPGAEDAGKTDEREFVLTVNPFKPQIEDLEPEEPERSASGTPREMQTSKTGFVLSNVQPHDEVFHPEDSPEQISSFEDEEAESDIVKVPNEVSSKSKATYPISLVEDTRMSTPDDKLSAIMSPVPDHYSVIEPVESTFDEASAEDPRVNLVQDTRMSSPDDKLTPIMSPTADQNEGIETTGAILENISAENPLISYVEDTELSSPDDRLSKITSPAGGQNAEFETFESGFEQFPSEDPRTYEILVEASKTEVSDSEVEDLKSSDDNIMNLTFDVDDDIMPYFGTTEDFSPVKQRVNPVEDKNLPECTEKLPLDEDFEMIEPQDGEEPKSVPEIESYQPTTAVKPVEQATVSDDLAPVLPVEKPEIAKEGVQIDDPLKKPVINAISTSFCEIPLIEEDILRAETLKTERPEFDLTDKTVLLKDNEEPELDVRIGGRFEIDDYVRISVDFAPRQSTSDVESEEQKSIDERDPVASWKMVEDRVESFEDMQLKLSAEDAQYLEIHQGIEGLS